jgi:DASH complex subunit DAD2
MGKNVGLMLIKLLLAVATVLGNWHNVLRAISMASSECNISVSEYISLISIVKIPKPKDEEDSIKVNVEKKTESELPLPQTLVRIPTEHAPMLQQSSSGVQGNGES